MLLPLDGRNIYYDLMGLETGDVVCFAHSLAADSGMWAEQLPVLVGAGFRVLRLDMRGHGGTDAVPGDYTMEQVVELLPNARYEEITGARHFPNVECPEVFNRLLMDWLEPYR